MVRSASCLPRACFSATIPSQCSSHHKRALPHVYPDSLVSNIAETPPVEIGLMICPSQGRMRRDGANVNGESCPRKPALTSSTKRLRTSKSRSRVARQGENQPRSKLKPRLRSMRLRRQDICRSRASTSCGGRGGAKSRCAGGAGRGCRHGHGGYGVC